MKVLLDFSICFCTMPVRKIGNFKFFNSIAKVSNSQKIKKNNKQGVLLLKGVKKSKGEVSRYRYLNIR